MTPLLSRKDFLKLAASALPAIATARVARADELDAVRRERIADVFRMYHLQGSHRTATDVDHDSGQWLAGEAARIGAEVAPRQFTLDRVALEACYVESGGTRREGVPFFDGGLTTADGIRGRIGSAESGAPVALVTLDQAAISSEGQSIAALRRSPNLRAIVAVTRGRIAGLCPSNARSFSAPYGVPVVQVSSTQQAWLEELERSGAEIHVLARAARQRAAADNVMATVPGRRPELPPIVVMTPRSGWWQCVSERGGGLACWLETMRAVAEVRPARTVRFIASSGHELGHLGLDAFLHEEPALIKSAAAWVHLGACIGAAGGTLRVQSSDDAIEAIAVEALRGSGGRVDALVPRGTVPAGEARNIHEGGGRYISLLGGGPYFHNPLDLWPTAVDLDAVTRYATAVVEMTLRLSKA